MSVRILGNAQCVLFAQLHTFVHHQTLQRPLFFLLNFSHAAACMLSRQVAAELKGGFSMEGSTALAG